MYSCNLNGARKAGAVFLVAAVWACLPPAARAENDGALLKLKETVIHFDRAAPDVYRSGRIPKEAVPLLKDLGIRTVVNFDNDESRAKREEADLKRFGIYMIWLPWSGWEYPPQELMDTFLKLMKTPELRPVLVHCKRGSERTGTALAVWRIAEGNWAAEEAYAEMKRYDFRRFRYGHLKKHVYRFARERKGQDAKITGVWEHVKTNVLYLIYQLRKLNPFWAPAAAAPEAGPA